MTDSNGQTPAIADQAAFLRTLGINPDNVAPHSIQVGFTTDGTPVVQFQAVLVVTPQQLGVAFLASGGQQIKPDIKPDIKPAADALTAPKRIGRPPGSRDTKKRTSTKKTAAAKTAAAKKTTTVTPPQKTTE